MTDELRFLDVRNFVSSASYFRKWVKTIEFRVDQLLCTYEHLNSYEKIEYVSPIENN